MEETTLSGHLSKENITTRSLKLNKKYLFESVCYLLIVFLIYSSLRKILSFKSYTDEATFYLQNMHIVKLEVFIWIVRWSVGILCFIELAGAISISISKYRLLGLYLAFCAMIVILFYLLTILQINNAISTYFGSIFPYVSYLAHLIITMCFMFLTLACILIKNKI